ncbi:MAG: PQQ-binding-like beta-propeller repeat protein, partial [Rubrivivax sp.]
MRPARHRAAKFWRGVAGWGAMGLALVFLAGCAADKPKPKALEAVTPKIAGRQVWSVKLDSVRFPLSVVSRDGNFIVASTDGTVLALEANSGRELWRTSAGAELSAGVGSDGRFSAV